MLAWMDLEMTGLDPERHAIIEIATLITDDQLELVAEGPNLAIAPLPGALEGMEDVVRKMHTKSGLLDRMAAETIDLATAGAATLAFLKEHISEAGTVPLCGNSITVDRRFLARYLPEIEDFLNYRSIDVSTIKELARRWRPRVYSDRPKKDSSHRALDDIRESIEELRWYRWAWLGGADSGGADSGGADSGPSPSADMEPVETVKPVESR